MSRLGRSGKKAHRHHESTLEREDVPVISHRLPYLESLLLSELTLKEDIPTFECPQSTLRDRLNSYKRRFPRLCHKVNFNMITQLHSRTETWIVQFIEQCYDRMTSMLTRHAKTIRRMTPFPVTIDHYLTHTYSVTGIRNQLMADILFTLDTLSELKRPIEAVSLTSDRVHLFQQFLTENFDIYSLAIYLHTRQLIQDRLGIRFQRNKTSLLCMHHSQLQDFVHHLLQGNKAQQTKLIRRVLEREVRTGSSQTISCQALLRVVCDLWNALPSDMKAEISQTNTNTENIKQLSRIYDNDGERLDELQRSIRQVEQSLAAVEAKMLTNEKRTRQLERELNEGILTDEAVAELRSARIELTQLTATRLALRSELLGRRNDLEQLTQKIDSLWTQILNQTQPVVVKRTEASRWRLEAQDLLVSSIENLDSLELRDLDDLPDEALMLETNTSRLETRPNRSSRPDSSRRENSAELLNYDILARIRKLEEEAFELRTVAANEFVELDLKKFELEPKNDENVIRKNESIRRQIIFTTASRFSIECIAVSYSAVTDRLTAALMNHKVSEAYNAALQCIFDQWIGDSLNEIITDNLQKALLDARVDFLAENSTHLIFEEIIEELLNETCQSELIIESILRINRNRLAFFSIVKKYLEKRRPLLVMRKRLTLEAMGMAESYRWRKHLEFAFSQWRRKLRRRKAASIVNRNIRAASLKRCLGCWLMAWKQILHLRSMQERSLEIQFTASLALQRLVRGYLARKSVFEMKRAAVYVTKFFMRLRSSFRFREIRFYLRSLDEKSTFLRSKLSFNLLKLSLLRWMRIQTRSLAVVRIISVVTRRFLTSAMQKWIMYHDAQRNDFETLSSAAKVIQCRFRLYFVKRYIFDYYRWAASFRKMQGLIRRRGVRQRFIRFILMHRYAIVLQKHIRGHLLRHKMKDDRIAAMHSAAVGNSFQKLQYYVEHFPELVYAHDRLGNTLLHAAAMGASMRVVKMLLKLGLNPNVFSFQGYTPLHLVILSASAGRDECFDYMIEHGFDDRIEAPGGTSSLMLAAKHGRAHILQQLLEYGADPNAVDEEGNTPLQVACKGGHMGVIKRLLEHGVDPNRSALNGYRPIYYAIDAPDGVAVCQLLLDYGADVNVYHEETLQTPIMIATIKRAVNIVELFLVHGSGVAAIDVNGWSIGHYAAAMVPGSADLYSLLVTADAALELTDHEGLAPIHVAAMYGNVVFLRCLLEGGADPNIRSFRGSDSYILEQILRH